MYHRVLRRGIAAAAILVAANAAIAAPIDAIRGGNMASMIPEIIAIYEDNGLFWDHGIEWTTGPFTTTYWYYDYTSDVIMVGAVPAAEEVEAYWREWSRVLTDGEFDPASFFASPQEAAELARYNQFVLATHESAHAITYRYDIEHLDRHGYEVNCREYYADRLTVAILNDQASQDVDMARWRDRYAELVTAMGETIPAQYRVSIPSFAALEGDCAVIKVEQPTPATMQPYASAYFERYRVLLGADLPPMAEVFRTHLSGVVEAKLAERPLDPERADYELVKVGEAEGATLGGYYPDSDLDQVHRSRQAAFGPDGTLYFSTIAYDSDARTLEVGFDTDPDPVNVPVGSWSHPAENVEMSSLAALGPATFVISLEHWQKTGENSETFVVTFLLGNLTGGAWTFDAIDLEGMKQGAALRAPDDRLYLLANPEHGSPNSSDHWVGLEASLETGDMARELEIGSTFDFPIAIDASDRLYEQLGYLLWRSTPEGNDTVLLGAILPGLVDGPATSAQIQDIEVLQFMADGTALMADSGRTIDEWTLRALRPLR